MGWGWSEWRRAHWYPITLVEWYAERNEYRVYVEGVGLSPGYSHMFSHKVTQQDINMYLFQGMDK